MLLAYKFRDDIAQKKNERESVHTRALERHQK